MSYKKIHPTESEKKLWNEKKYIAAIKEMRARTRCFLKDAKESLEFFYGKMEITPDIKYNDIDLGRISLVQEIVETLRKRGHWIPKDWKENPSDIIGAIAIALDKKA